MTQNTFLFWHAAQLTEDFCGVEPITHPPILRETRPPPIVDPYKVEKAYHRFDSILWGSKWRQFTYKIETLTLNIVDMI